MPDRGDKLGRQRKPYTGFGKAMQKLMADRNIRSWVQLAAQIHETTGRSYSHQSMSKYASGTTQTPSEFVESFAEALGLSRAERRDLAEQYAYHSRPEDP